jgi:hypothetical protein
MGQVSNDEALAILKPFVMQEDPRIKDLVIGPKAPSHVPWAQAAEADSGCFFTAIMQDPRVDDRAFAGFSLPEAMLDDLIDLRPQALVMRGEKAESLAAFVKLFALRLIQDALEVAIEARLERGNVVGVRSPHYGTRWASDG